MRVQLTRDSVAMGDDTYAPHAGTRDVPDGTSLRWLLDEVLTTGYLATIAGGRATWIATTGDARAGHAGAGDATVLAVLAQQWTAARLLPAGTAPLATLAGADGTLRLHFTYRAQRDPEAEYARLTAEVAG
ncbi:hypothetical protein J5Y04_06640 [Kitasatospora sp. RG8]|uniref:hypothetical protein n=1 Tax=Kitasatospora sp. RG8 TaxID=2820815 RepID=UPI001ADF6749|nr:hypothetical protein [Kitasatospora sp. RG8]MBP0449225.1 hypothetical protein [Kitasatospora sp. RG8]